jgi:hypothetical protein
MEMSVFISINFTLLNAVRTVRGCKTFNCPSQGGIHSSRDRDPSQPGRYVPGKAPRYPLDRRLGGPQNWSGRFYGIDISCLLREQIFNNVNL